MSYPATVVLPDTVLGDYYPPSADGAAQILIGPILFDGVAPLVELDRIEMRFYKRGSPVFRADSDAGQTPDTLITITDAATWAASIDTITTFLSSAGIWKWDMGFYPAGSSKPITLYTGKITVASEV